MKELRDFSRCCIHTVTLKNWAIEKLAAKLQEAGINGITVWRDALTGKDIRKIGHLLRGYGLEIVSLCRGGFFPSSDPDVRRHAIQDNINAIELAAELGAPMLVLVCGSAKGQSLDESRLQIRGGIEACLKIAEKNNVILAIEPLHPMYAGDRSAINTMSQANEMAEYFGCPNVGVALDVYHVWWDPTLPNEIKRCGEKGNLKAFHVCDWMVPTTDMLNDRGLMGEGCVNIREIRNWVEQTGFDGFNEVEIFSTRHWGGDQEDYFKNIQKAYLSCT
jgi:sugar phosphate isomerase/epimerase